MREVYLNTLKKLEESNLFAFIDRDWGQIDSQERPAVKFPFALIKITETARKNINPTVQQISLSVQIRIGTEKLIGQSNLERPERLKKALEYYDITNNIEGMFQGLKLDETDRWICSKSVDEERPDLNVVRTTFTTGILKEF